MQRSVQQLEERVQSQLQPAYAQAGACKEGVVKGGDGGSDAEGRSVTDGHSPSRLVGEQAGLATDAANLHLKLLNTEAEKYLEQLSASANAAKQTPAAALAAAAKERRDEVRLQRLQIQPSVKKCDL